MQGSLSWLHFNLTGGFFPDGSVSTGIYIHTHTHTTSATKECGTLLRWAEGGRQLGKKLLMPSGLVISLEGRCNYTKANGVGSELLPAGGLCQQGPAPPLSSCHPGFSCCPVLSNGWDISWSVQRILKLRSTYWACCSTVSAHCP